MKFRIVIIILSVLFVAVPLFSSNLNEIEPNGCITLIDGSDPYQAMTSGDTLFGTIGLGDNEGCLYFQYADGDEYLEDLYVLNIAQGGNYSITLSHAGTQDLDIYIMDLDLNVLNPEGCGDYYCGITCGTPEIVNKFLNPGMYILGVNLASVYYCSAPYDTSYVLSVAPFTGGDKPVVDSLSKAGNPFRVFIFGNTFLDGVKIYIAGTDWQNFALDGSEMIKLKKGNSLKAMFPKDGSWVPITIVNPGNVSSSIEYNRYYNMWREAGR
jgi:hypothetical protein